MMTERISQGVADLLEEIRQRANTHGCEDWYLLTRAYATLKLFAEARQSDPALRGGAAPDGWEMLLAATRIFGAMCENDNPGCEKPYLALCEFLRKSGHDYGVNGRQYVEACAIVDRMNSRALHEGRARQWCFEGARCQHPGKCGAACIEDVDGTDPPNATPSVSVIESLRAEVDRLNKWADTMTDAVMKERQTGEAYQAELRAKIAELERDAARYRWLRNRACEGNGTSSCPGVYMSDDNCLLAWKELDAAVDAELQRNAAGSES